MRSNRLFPPRGPRRIQHRLSNISPKYSLAASAQCWICRVPRPSTSLQRGISLYKEQRLIAWKSNSMSCSSDVPFPPLQDVAVKKIVFKTVFRDSTNPPKTSQIPRANSIQYPPCITAKP